MFIIGHSTFRQPQPDPAVFRLSPRRAPDPGQRRALDDPHHDTERPGRYTFARWSAPTSTKLALRRLRRSRRRSGDCRGVLSEAQAVAVALQVRDRHVQLLSEGLRNRRLSVRPRELVERGHEVAMFSMRLPAEPHPEAPQLLIHGLASRLPMLLAREAAAAVEARSARRMCSFSSRPRCGTSGASAARLFPARATARRAGARVTLMAHELYIPAPLATGPPRRRAGLRVARRNGALLGARRSHVRDEDHPRRCHPRGPSGAGCARASASCAWARARFPRRGRPRAGGRCAAEARRVLDRGRREVFDVVLEAFERIARELPLAELVIIGASARRSAPGLERSWTTSPVTRARPIRSRARWPLPDVAREIAELDVYLFPMDTGANTRSSTLPTALGSGWLLRRFAVRTPTTSCFETKRTSSRASAPTGAAFVGGAGPLARPGAPRAHRRRRAPSLRRSPELGTDHERFLRRARAAG